MSCPGKFPPCLALLAALVTGPIAPAASPASTLPPEKGTWIQVQSAHFTLFSDAPEKRTVEIAASLERFRAVLSIFHTRFTVDPPRPTLIYVFKSDADYTPYKTRFGGKPTEHQGYFLPREYANYVTLEAQWGQDASRIVYHEFVHQFIDSNLSSVPIWFNEGVAEYYSTFQATEKAAQIGLPVESHVFWLATHTLIPLRDLFLMDSSSPGVHEGERMGTFYAESWALTHYLLGPQSRRKSQVGAFVDRLRDGVPLDEAFRLSFQIGYDALQKEVEAYVARGRFAYTNVQFSEALKADTAIRTTTMQRPDVLARLGDLLAQIGPDRSEDAEAHFREAQRLEPGNPAAAAGLGSLDWARGRFHEAAKEFEAAVAADPGSFLYAYFGAAALLGRAPGERSVGADGGTPSADRDRARELLRQVIRLKPDFGEAYVVLGETYLPAEEPPEEGIALLEKARAILPARMDVVANLVALYIRKGDRARAGDLVEKVLSTGSDSRLAGWGKMALEGYDRAHATAAAPPEDPTPGAPPVAAGVPGAAEAGRGKMTLVEYYESLLKDIQDPEARKQAEERLREARARAAYPAQVQAYNQAVTKANGRDYAGAIGILEKLQGEVKDPELAAAVSSLLTRLKEDAKKFQKPAH